MKRTLRDFFSPAQRAAADAFVNVDDTYRKRAIAEAERSALADRESRVLRVSGRRPAVVAQRTAVR